MLRLAYLSHASDTFGPSDLTNILAISRRRNPVDQLTGMLIYHDHEILQFLEGPNAKVEACFDRIQRDPRHAGIVVLKRLEVKERSFSNWSMGHVAPIELPKYMRSSLKSLREISDYFGNVRHLEASRGRHDVSAIIRRFLARIEPSAFQ